MKIKTPVKPLVFSLCFALSGCQGDQNSSDAGLSPQSEADEDALTLVVEQRQKPHDADMKSQVKKAIQDLANRLNIISDQIKVIRTENVTWRDGSLGCPQEGMMYAQALVPGTLIVLGSGDVEYEYHSGGGRAPSYCSNPQAPASISSAE